MISNRKESFRYEFPEKIPALFTIKQIDEKDVTTASGEAEIVNISLQGIRFRTKLDIPKVNEKKIHLHISFKLNEKQFQLLGKIVWKRNKYPENEYGMQLFTNETEQMELLQHLKIYARKKQV